MLDELEEIQGYHSPAAINDKPIEANGTSPKDDAIAAKDFVTTNLQERKEDILKAVIAAANEADAKHMAEQGTPST